MVHSPLSLSLSLSTMGSLGDISVLSRTDTSIAPHFFIRKSDSSLSPFQTRLARVTEEQFHLPAFLPAINHALPISISVTIITSFQQLSEINAIPAITFLSLSLSLSFFSFSLSSSHEDCCVLCTIDFWE